MIRPELMSPTLAETHFGLIQRDPHTAYPPLKVPPLRRVMAGVTALAMAITVVAASAMPTRADDRSDNLAKALAAIAIIGIIAHEAGKNRDDDRPNHPRPNHPQPNYPQPHHPQPEPAYKPRVPAACAIEIESGRRNVTVYPARCLRDKGFSYRLPERCARDIRIYGRPDRIYSEQCLRDAGFRIEERRHGRDRYKPFNNYAD